MKKRLRKVIIVGEHMCKVVLMAGVVYTAFALHLYSLKKTKI